MSDAPFRAMLERPEGVGTWTFFSIPFDVRAAFGSNGQVPILGTINDHPFRGVAMPMGDGTHFVVVNKTIRQAIGAHAGATVQVVLHRDTAERRVALPADFQQALEQHPAAHERFLALSASHRNEYVEWIEGAKKRETRSRRIQATLERLMDVAARRSPAHA